MTAITGLYHHEYQILEFDYWKVLWVKSQMQGLVLVVLPSIVYVKNLARECCGPILPLSHPNFSG